MMHHVFLSYSRKDMPFMKRIQTDLQRAKLAVWTDEQLEPGTTSWQLSIEQAIRNAGCVMCIFSPDAANSQWVREELNYARMMNIQIIPLLARGDQASSIPFGFSSLQWVDIRNREVYLSNMKALIIDLQKRYAHVPLSDNDGSKTVATVNGLGTNYPQNSLPSVFRGIMPTPFEWCDIAAGKTIVDGVKQDVDFFYLSKYPITVAQFNAFIDDDNGYHNADWWQFSDDALTWFKQNETAADPIFKENDVPRAEICWFEALAFCRWLEAIGRSPHLITLPTEAQWQRAAQGDDNRLYPWGNEYAKNRCNTLRSSLNRTTPVTTYPGGVSPFSVFDMCGNVAEWCLTDYTMFSPDVTGNAPRVVRGGAYDSGRSFAQVIVRNYANPDVQSQTIGFRIAAIPN
ncbi:MAG: SUMF1/EgtB/PvdO family nonheme iron enzyme [Phototrophicaceae bacterium]